MECYTVLLILHGTIVPECVLLPNHLLFGLDHSFINMAFGAI